MLQPCSMNSTASQSSSSGCVGGVPLRPKSKTVGDQRLAEVPRPDVVDRDAGRQRVAPVGHPAGQRGAPAGAGRRERLVARRLGLQVRFERLHAPRRAACTSRPAPRPPCAAASTAAFAASRFFCAASAFAASASSDVQLRRGRGLPRPPPAAAVRSSRAASPASSFASAGRRPSGPRAVRGGPRPDRVGPRPPRRPGPSPRPRRPAPLAGRRRLGRPACACSSAARAFAALRLRLAQQVLDHERPQARRVTPPAAAAPARSSGSPSASSARQARRRAAGPSAGCCSSPRTKRYVGASRLQSKARGMPSFSKSVSPGTMSVRTWYGSKKARNR